MIKHSLGIILHQHIDKSIEKDRLVWFDCGWPFTGVRRQVETATQTIHEEIDQHVRRNVGRNVGYGEDSNTPKNDTS